MTIITSSLFSLDCLSLLFCPRNQWMKNTPKNVVRKERDKTAMFAGQDFSSGVKCVVSSLRHDLRESVTSFLFTRHTDKRPFPLLAFFSSGLLWNTRTKSISIKYFKWRRRQTETRSRHSIPSYLLLCLDSRFPSFLPKYIKRKRKSSREESLRKISLWFFYTSHTRREKLSLYIFSSLLDVFSCSAWRYQSGHYYAGEESKDRFPGFMRNRASLFNPSRRRSPVAKRKREEIKKKLNQKQRSKVGTQILTFLSLPKKTREEGNHERNRDEDDLGWLLFSFLSSSSLPSSGSVFFAISYQQSLSLWLRLAFLLWDKSRGGEKNTRNHNYFHEDDHRLLHK